MNGTQYRALIVAAYVIATSAHGFADEKQNQSTAAATSKENSLVTRVQVERALQLGWPHIDLSVEQSLTDILDDLANHLSEDAGAQITFVLDHRELIVEGLDSLDDVMVRDLDIRPGTHTCGQVLELIWSQAEEELIGVPVDGYILVTTRTKSLEMVEPRFYDLSGLTEKRSNKTETSREDSTVGRSRPSSGKKLRQGKFGKGELL